MAVLWANLETHDFSITHTPYPEAAASAAAAPAASSDAAVDAAAPTAAAGMIAAAFGASVGDGVAAAAGVSSQDLASVFSIDALDEDARAAMRKQMAEAALQELDNRDFNSKVRWSGSAAAAEELFSEMLGSADHYDFLEARKEARKLPAAAAAAMEGQGAQQTDGNAAADSNGSSSSSNGSNGNGGNGHAENGQNSSGSKVRVAKRGRVPVAAGVSAGTGQLQGFRDVLMAAAGDGNDSYNGCSTSASESETDEGSGTEVNEPEPDAATASDVAVGGAMEAEGAVKEGNGNGNGNGGGGGGKHGVLQQLDLSYGWKQPDQRFEAATGG
jgi:hypothetical protein